MKKEHYNLYYLFLREKEGLFPCQEVKEKTMKKILIFFEKLKTKG